MLRLLRPAAHPLGPRFLRTLASGLLFGLLATGCSSQTKVKECNAFIDVINSGVDKIQRGATAPADGGASGELREMAGAMEQVGKDIAAVPATVPELKKFSQEYQAMAAEMAGAARDLATAVEKVDVPNMTKAQSRIDKAVTREDPLVDAINDFCRAP